jgi:glycosyltransferase involved in cell wall biosynthesis
MKVILINDYAFVNGGVAKVAIESAVGLAKQGIHVVFFSLVGPIEPSLIKNGVKVICLDQKDILNDPNRLRAAIHGLWNFSAAREMRKLLSQCSPNDTIVHIHGWPKALSSSPIREAIQRGFKVVLTLHDYFVACPNGGFYNYQQNMICPLKPLSFACISTHCDKHNYAEKIWRIFRQIVQRHFGKLPTLVNNFISLSDFSEKILAPFLPAHAKIFRLRNPVSASKTVRVPVENNSQFAYIGRISPEKGGELFAQAVSELGVKAVCVGDGPDKEYIESKYPSIEYLGWLSTDQIYQHIKKIRCLIFPSLCYETAGMVVQEVQALGIPVIVANQSAASDVVDDGVTGFHFKGGELNDLKDKIKQCQDDSDLVASMGQAAYQKFWDNPPLIETHVNELRDIYTRILHDA